ncbi:response regulator [Plesiocystis pacifica SIR-1]|uniref:Response regulator n=1 Tax=Plesiocystis pacifica SIR-1 TaxID=391625 RepID=A6G4K0_9BACT|nr:response regulator [Plesiocystis pacifica]EDM79120.1 response regulator [Plesiocystis pacifica SIR-1]
MTEKRVLVVDDDLDILRSFKRLLGDYAEVQIALGAEAAFEHMEKVQKESGALYDVVIVDFNMNGPNGAWLLKKVRDQFPDCERILLSGSSYMDLANYLDPGLVNRFLEKPVDMEDLIEAVSPDE